MKSNSLPEVSSIKSKKHNKRRFQPLLVSRPSRRCCHKQNISQGRQSSIPVKNSKLGQVCNPAFVLGHSWFCVSQGGVSGTEQPRAKPRSWWPVRIASYTATSRTSQARGLQRTGKAVLQTPASYSTVEKITQKPALNSVTQSVFLCYLGAQHSHDKNKLHDKNTAQAKRLDTGRESVCEKEPTNHVCFNMRPNHCPFKSQYLWKLICDHCPTELLSRAEPSICRLCLQKT